MLEPGSRWAAPCAGSGVLDQMGELTCNLSQASEKLA